MQFMGLAQFNLCNVPGGFLAQPHQKCRSVSVGIGICGITSRKSKYFT